MKNVLHQLRYLVLICYAKGALTGLERWVALGHAIDRCMKECELILNPPSNGVHL